MDYWYICGRAFVVMISEKDELSFTETICALERTLSSGARVRRSQSEQQSLRAAAEVGLARW